jgi:hypothetical protein
MKNKKMNALLSQQSTKLQTLLLGWTRKKNLHQKMRCEKLLRSLKVRDKMKKNESGY